MTGRVCGAFAGPRGIVVALLFAAIASGSRSHAAEARPEAGSGGPTVSLAVGPRWYDAIGEGDSRPSPRSEAGAKLQLGYRGASGWQASAGGWLGGSFFDFEGVGVSGDLREATFGLSVEVARSVQVSNRRSLCLGLGAEYGEARSWLRNLLVERDGPHSYLGGGYLRLGMRWAAQRWAFGPDAVVSVYRGHTANALLKDRYDWMGSAIFMGLAAEFNAGRSGSSAGDESP